MNSLAKALYAAVDAARAEGVGAEVIEETVGAFADDNIDLYAYLDLDEDGNAYDDEFEDYDDDLDDLDDLDDFDLIDDVDSKEGE